MPQQSSNEDFRKVLREKALKHRLYYINLGARTCAGGAAAAAAATVATIRPAEAPRRSSAAECAPATARALGFSQANVSELVRQFEPGPMQYLRPPRPSTPPDDITSSDDDDRAAVRRRSRDLSDDSAVELEPRPRRHSHPRTLTPPPPGELFPRREQTLLEAHVVELGRRSSEGAGAAGEPEARGRCVRTPSVVVSDYSDGTAAVGTTPEAVDWLRARSLSADSACSSSSTLSSREDDDFEPPVTTKRMIEANESEGAS